MKKIVFAIAFVFVIVGCLSTDFVFGIRDCFSTLSLDVGSVGVFQAIKNFTHNMENVTTDKLSYHDELVNLNSLYMRLSNTKLVKKDNTIVAKNSNGYLLNPRAYIKDSTIKDYIQKVDDIYQISTQNNARFLYVMAPSKGYEMPYPQNISDYTKSNCDRFSEYMSNTDIPFLNLYECMKKDNITEEEMFFATDHHWKPYYGMWSSEQILSYLSKEYGYLYDSSINDISNYNVTTYKDWFLGSQGKKVGKYFTALGCDDIDIILPRFDTSMTEEQPGKNLVRSGSFDQTIMYLENVNTKDLYNLSPYVAYSGGDFREQIITNHNNPDGNRVVLIRDSFSCVTAPFLSLNTSTLYVVDVRDFDYYAGSKIVFRDYIDKIKPDYVVVMYNGVPESDKLFDFN